MNNSRENEVKVKDDEIGKVGYLILVMNIRI